VKHLQLPGERSVRGVAGDAVGGGRCWCGCRCGC
jgi:hypothetical protein